MDIAQLKLLASRVRALLAEHNVTVGHNQSLELVTALSGLQNWAQLNSFPERVKASEITQSSLSRLATRIERKHNIWLSPVVLRQALEAAPGQTGYGTASLSPSAPEVWPAGPARGVYVTTSREALDALLERYDQASDGSLAFAEATADMQGENVIELGEFGLSSTGLSKVPSGTLLVIGPLRLNEEDWEDSAGRLEWGCLRALNEGFRVAVLVETPQPELLHHDVELAVRGAAPPGDTCVLMLQGDVREGGHLVQCSPFVPPAMLSPSSALGPGSADVLPERVRAALSAKLEKRHAGVLFLGEYAMSADFGLLMVEAALGLSESLGPACRVQFRRRAPSSQSSRIAANLENLPLVSSVASARAQGYRRIVVDNAELGVRGLLPYASDMLFLVRFSAYCVEDVLQRAWNLGGPSMNTSTLEHFFGAVLGAQVQGTERVCSLWDMCLVDKDSIAPLLAHNDPNRLEQALLDQRQIQWERELEELAAQGEVDLKDHFETYKEGATIEFQSTRLLSDAASEGSSMVSRRRRLLNMLLDLQKSKQRG